MDAFAEWPPPNYYSPNEEELAEMEMAILDSDSVGIGTAGMIEAGRIEDGIPVFKLPADYPANYTGALARYEMCHHGLSAWLCADPINHYPRDNSW